MKHQLSASTDIKIDDVTNHWTVINHVIFGLVLQLTFAVTFCGIVSAQTSPDEDWKFIAEKNGVQAFYKIAKCHPDEPNLLYLRFKNLNDHDVTVKWDEEIEFDNSKVWSSKSLAEPMVSAHEISLNGGESKEGLCRDSNLSVHLFRIEDYSESTSVTNVTLIDFVIN